MSGLVIVAPSILRYRVEKPTKNSGENPTPATAVGVGNDTVCLCMAHVYY